MVHHIKAAQFWSLEVAGSCAFGRQVVHHTTERRMFEIEYTIGSASRRVKGRHTVRTSSRSSVVHHIQAYKGVKAHALSGPRGDAITSH
jgi:hypothetical protein